MSNYIDKLAAVQKWIEDSGLPEREIYSVTMGNLMDMPPRIQIEAEAFLLKYRGKKCKRRILHSTSHYEILDGEIQVACCQRQDEPTDVVTI